MLRVTQRVRSGSALKLLNRATPVNATPALLLTGRRDFRTAPLPAILSQRTPVVALVSNKPALFPSRSFSAQPVADAAAPITEADVIECQANWAHAICDISKVYLEKGDFVATAGEYAGMLYGYGHTDVLFKPTKATKHPFRPTPEDAMSYFVGAYAMKNEKFHGEDKGFAINGGNGWSKVVFSNHNIKLFSDCAIAMGSYDFTDAKTTRKSTVEYTFGYTRCDDGQVRIFLHHSSVPFSPTSEMM